MCTRKWTRYSYWENIKLSHYGQKMKILTKNEKKMRCYEKNEKNEERTAWNDMFENHRLYTSKGSTLRRWVMNAFEKEGLSSLEYSLLLLFC